MRLRTRLNLVVAGLSAAFVLVLLAAELQSTRASVREEIESANRVAAQLLGQLASIYSNVGGPDRVMQFLNQLGRVRSNEVTLISPAGAVLYASPKATYKADREAPVWFAHLLAPQATRVTFPLRGGVRLVIEAQPSRAVLDAWDDITQLTAFGVGMLVLVNALAFWSVARVLKPFPIIVGGLERIERGELTYRLPPLPGDEASIIGGAFNRMAEAVEDKVHAERQARDAEARLEERREMATLADQRVEEERRLIAHELHDEFGQSVTAIRSLALAIASQAGARDPATGDVARLISEEAARLYDAMHGLIPRLTPLSLDTLGLTATLENLAADWQRRHPAVVLTLSHDLPADLSPGVTLAIYRVVQEGVINALRHADPSRVDVDVHSGTAGMTVTITDDGVGLPTLWAKPGHFGLRGLTDRVTQLGGIFTAGNAAPAGAARRGTRLTAEIPLGHSAPGPVPA
jgi:two-component system sensor histidine kinase UhpB